MWLLAPNGSVLGISVQHSFATLKFFMASVSGKFYDKKNKLPYSSHCIVHTVFLYLPTYLPTHLPTYSPTYLHVLKILLKIRQFGKDYGTIETDDQTIIIIISSSNSRIIDLESFWA